MTGLRQGSKRQTERLDNLNIEGLCLQERARDFTRLKIRLKISQLQKVHFIKVNDLKLTQVELFKFLHFMCIAANASELFCMAHLANIESFLYHSNLSF